jgi:hypothetical protein
MIFELHGRFVHETVTVRAVAGVGGVVVTTEAGARRGRDLSHAIRIACTEIGPLMERGDRAGEGWGLLVVAGPASVAYGNWPAGPPREPGPELATLRRILALYRPGDGARAALNNAAKVIDAYADRGGRRLTKAA